MAKYNEVMSRVAVTPEMRERVLSNVENARAAKINSKKKISRTIIRWFPLAAAACLVLIVGIGVGNVYKDNNESVGTSNDDATSQGLEDCASLDQLCEKVGFDVPDLSADIPFEVKQTVYTDVFGVARVSYNGADDTYIELDKGLDEGYDVSGDNNDYENTFKVSVSGYSDVKITMKGNGDSVSLATWTCDGYAYALCFSPGVDRDTATDLVIKAGGLTGRTEG